MNFIEQILSNVLKNRFNISLDEYSEMVSYDELEYDKALIKETISIVSEEIKNGFRT